MLNALLTDAAVAISVALQHGIPAAALAKSIDPSPIADKPVSVSCAPRSRDRGDTQRGLSDYLAIDILQ